MTRPGSGSGPSASSPLPAQPGRSSRPEARARRVPSITPRLPARRAPSITPRLHARTNGAVAAALGMLVLAWPLAWAPAWAYAAAGAGAIAVLGASLFRAERSRGWPVIAVAAAVASCSFSRAGTAVLAAEGLFILAYLLAADAPAGLKGPGRWFRLQAFLVIPGLIASGAVAAALSLQRAESAWLTVVGLAAAVAAYLVALPARAPRQQAVIEPAPGPSDVDVE